MAYENCECTWDERGHIKSVGRNCYAEDIGYYANLRGFSVALKHPSSKPEERKKRGLSHKRK